ncbi:OB-fold domain-containing protein [Polaromonas sp. P1(28)-13]|nr:OB-fold domain-containing protein [Polaromonas sp. P1(28)-13]
MTTTEPQVITDTISLQYNYSLGEVAGRFMDGLKEGKILATRCSKSALTYLPPRAFCEQSFEPCDSWVEAGLSGVIEQSTIVVRGYEGKRKAPQAVAFVRLDGVDSAIANYVDGVDFSDLQVAMKKIVPGTRVKVVFSDERSGRMTDFSFHLA